MRVSYLALFLALALAPAAAPAGDKDKGDGFVPMFNGKDLTGWVNVNCAPETFFVKDGMIITTGKPTGYLRTQRQYENFIAEFEWMHVPPKPDAVGNSGFFVWADPIPAVGTPYTRGIEVQVLVNLEKKDHYTSQGDLFSIWGATCKPDRPHPQGWERCLPSENRCKGANEWNHYKVVANDGVIKLHVNGKEVSGVSQCKPRKGYLALESEGSECRFKNLKIKELPSTNPKPEETCNVAQGHKQLFTGLDLRGWKASDEQKKHWKPRDWVLVSDGKSKGDDARLLTDKEYGDFELIVDWRLPAKKGGAEIVLRPLKPGDVRMDVGGPGTGTIRYEYPKVVGGGRIVSPKEGAERPAGQWNRFRIRMKADRVTVFLNDKMVIDNVELKYIPYRGPIGLHHEGEYSVEFGNLFARELGKDE